VGNPGKSTRLPLGRIDFLILMLSLAKWLHFSLSILVAGHNRISGNREDLMMIAKKSHPIHAPSSMPLACRLHPP
jgi:hypothetical protein